MLLTRFGCSEPVRAREPVPAGRGRGVRVRRRAACSLLAVVLLRSPATAAQTRQVPVESLIYDLKNPDPARRREAATRIGQNKVQSATPDLVAAVHDVDPVGAPRDQHRAADRCRTRGPCPASWPSPPTPRRTSASARSRG